MPSNDDRLSIAAEIRAELARQQMSQRDVAKILDMPQPSIQLRLAGKRAWRAEELAALARGLGVPVESFFRQAVPA